MRRLSGRLILLLVVMLVVSQAEVWGAAGDLVWKFETGGEIRSCPAIGQNGTIYISSFDGNLYAFNNDGTLKWKYQTGINYSAPTVAHDGTIYICSQDNNFYAINPDGSLKWKSEMSLYGGGLSSPIIGYDGTIYIGSNGK